MRFATRRTLKPECAEALQAVEANGQPLKAYAADKGLSASNAAVRVDNLYQVALWADMLRVQSDEVFYAYMVDNQAIVIPETIEAIRALTGTVRTAESIVRTNTALGIDTSLM